MLEFSKEELSFISETLKKHNLYISSEIDKENNLLIPWFWCDNPNFDTFFVIIKREKDFFITTGVKRDNSFVIFSKDLLKTINFLEIKKLENKNLEKTLNIAIEYYSDNEKIRYFKNIVSQVTITDEELLDSIKNNLGKDYKEITNFLSSLFSFMEEEIITEEEGEKFILQMYLEEMFSGKSISKISKEYIDEFKNN